MQAPEHEVFHRVFHRRGANRSHKYPALQFKYSGMFYNMFTLIPAYLFCVLIRNGYFCIRLSLIINRYNI